MSCLVSIVGCTSNNDAIVNAYLYMVEDCSVPINGSKDTIPEDRTVRFYFALKNESSETYCLPFGYNGGDAFCSKPYIHFSVQKDGKTIVLDRKGARKSCICYKITDTEFQPNDSAIVVLWIHNYKHLFDSLNINITTPALDLVNTLTFTSKYDGGENMDKIVPTIIFHNNNRNKFKDIVRVEKRMREFLDVHIDSINNIVYACPHYWGDTIMIYPRVEKK